MSCPHSREKTEWHCLATARRYKIDVVANEWNKHYPHITLPKFLMNKTVIKLVLFFKGYGWVNFKTYRYWNSE